MTWEPRRIGPGGGKRVSERQSGTVDTVAEHLPRGVSSAFGQWEDNS